MQYMRRSKKIKVDIWTFTRVPEKKKNLENQKKTLGMFISIIRTVK